MHILVTGAAGFVGTHLVRSLLDGSMDCERVIGADCIASTHTDARFEPHVGNIADPDFVRSLVTPDIGLVFHLAGMVSGAAEANFDAGFATNLDGTRLVLEACRSLRTVPRIVVASSIAVFGQPLPQVILDSTTPMPTLSYGTAKVIGEYLVDDYTRRGFVDGRAPRLSGVVVRPPAPNGALSAFNSDLIREPLAGRPLVSPVSAEARIWIQSIDSAVRNLIHAATTPTSEWGAHRTVTLPAVSVTIREILDAVSRARGQDVWPLVKFAPDPVVEPMFGRWPKDHPSERACAIGFTRDESIDSIIRDYQKAQCGSR